MLHKKSKKEIIIISIYFCFLVFFALAYTFIKIFPSELFHALIIFSTFVATYMLAFYFTPKEKTEYTEYLKSRVGKVMIVDEGGLKKDSYGKIRNQEQSNTDDFHKMSKWDRLSYFASISYDNNVDFIKEGEKVVVVSVREKDKCLMCKNSS